MYQRSNAQLSTLNRQWLPDLAFAPSVDHWPLTVSQLTISVGLSGLEPLTPALSAQCSNRLSYRPLSIINAQRSMFNRPFTIDNSSGACTPAASHPANASSGTLTAEEWQDNLFRLSNPVWLSPLHSSRPALSRLPASFPLRFLVQPLQPGGWVTSTLGVELFARSPELSLKISDMSLHCIRSYSRSDACLRQVTLVTRPSQLAPPRHSSRKEVIQPHLPVRLPCYDFVPVIRPTLGSSSLAVKSPTSGVPNSHDVTGGVYKARERIQRSMADLRLLATPASCRRVSACNPN